MADITATDKNIKPWKNDWTVLRVIDQGGQGIVSKLRSKKDQNKHAVLKQIVKRWKDDDQAKNRLEKEAETLQLLNRTSAKVPELYDSSKNHPYSEPFILMEFIPGIRFDKWLTSNSPVDLETARSITISVTDTIVECHKLQLGHRDIKPANLILRDGNINAPYILDFGISFDSRQTVILTRDGETFWNEFIMLPECQDRQGGHQDLRSDITALVGLFYSCLTGKPPIVLRDASSRAPHVRDEKYLKSLPIEYERLVWFFDKGFSYSIDERFETIELFIQELKKLSVDGDENEYSFSEEYKRFDGILVNKDRRIQLNNLNIKSSRMINQLTSLVRSLITKDSAPNGEISTSNGSHQFPYIKEQYPDLNEHLNQNRVVILTFKRKNYDLTIKLLIVSFSVNMDIVVLVALPEDPLRDPFKDPLNWEKLIVIKEGKELEHDQLMYATNKICSKIARALRSISLQIESKK